MAHIYWSTNPDDPDEFHLFCTLDQAFRGCAPMKNDRFHLGHVHTEASKDIVTDAIQSQKSSLFQNKRRTNTPLHIFDPDHFKGFNKVKIKKILQENKLVMEEKHHIYNAEAKIQRLNDQ